MKHKKLFVISLIGAAIIGLAMLFLYFYWFNFYILYSLNQYKNETDLNIVPQVRQINENVTAKKSKSFSFKDFDVLLPWTDVKEIKNLSDNSGIFRVVFDSGIFVLGYNNSFVNIWPDYKFLEDVGCYAKPSFLTEKSVLYTTESDWRFFSPTERNKCAGAHLMLKSFLTETSAIYEFETDKFRGFEYHWKNSKVVEIYFFDKNNDKVGYGLTLSANKNNREITRDDIDFIISHFTVK